MKKLCWLLFIVVLLIPAVAHAQGVITQIDAITTAIQTRTAAWGPKLQGLAQYTFMGLATIEFAWATGELALRRPTLDEILGHILIQVLVFGFFFWLIQGWMTIGPILINSFREAATTASGLNAYTPGSIFAGGVVIDNNILNKISFWKPEESVGLIFAGILIEACYALIAAKMIEVLVDSYFVTVAGMFFMAAGGTRWTRDIVISVIRTTLAIGAELMILQFIAAIGMDLINQWIKDFEHIDSTNLITIIGLSIVLLYICFSVPRRVSGMISGASMGGGASLMRAGAGVAAGAAAAWGVGSKAATTTAGVAVQASQAAALASTQAAARAAAGGAAPSNPIAAAASFAGRTAQNFGSSVATDVGRRLSGTGTSQGSAPWRGAADLANRNRMVKEEMNRPTPPNTP